MQLPTFLSEDQKLPFPQQEHLINQTNLPSCFTKQLMQSKTGPYLSIHSFWFNAPMRNTRRKGHSSSGSSYRSDPGENRQDSLALAAGSGIWVIQLMQATGTSAAGLLMEGSHFISALVVQSGHSPHALLHQLPKIWGTRTEDREWQWRVRNKEVISGFLSHSLFQSLLLEQHSSALPYLQVFLWKSYCWLLHMQHESSEHCPASYARAAKESCWKSGPRDKQQRKAAISEAHY